MIIEKIIKKIKKTMKKIISFIYILKMQAITSIKGTKNPDAKLFLGSYLSSITSWIQEVSTEKTSRIFNEIFKFISNTYFPVAILSCDMESTNSDFLISSFLSYSQFHNFNTCVLRTTIKSATKKQILSHIQDDLFSRGGILFIESFEEWTSETLCFIFEYLCDFDEKIGFVLDISTDPRCFSLALDMDILQKLEVRQFFFPEFTEISSEILWKLTQKCNFPIMTNELFKALEASRSDFAFLKILKSSLLDFFLFNSDRKEIFIKEQGLEEFISIKDMWIEYLQQLLILTQVEPVSLIISIEDLHKSIYSTNDINNCCYLKDMLGKFKTQEFDKEETWKIYLQNLCTNGIITDEEIFKLFEEYSRIPVIQRTNSRESQNSKIYKWKFSYILPLLRNKVINKVQPITNMIIKIKNHKNYVLELSNYLDTDILSKMILQLSNNTQENDMHILFNIIKSYGRHIDLNPVYNDFVKATDVNESQKYLQ